MNSILARENDHFACDGFATIERFLDEHEVAKVRSDVNEALMKPQDTCCSRPHNTLLPLRWKDGVVRLFLSSKYRMQRLREVLNARDLKWISGYVSVKDANSPALWWHQDWWCWNHPISFRKTTSQVSVLCYLCDTTPQNGALRVLAGSHHKSLPLHAFLPEAHF